MPSNVVIPKEYAATVTQKKELYSHTWLLQLQSKTPIAFTPGQYASFLIADIRRPFSFALPTQTKGLDFIIGTQTGSKADQFMENLAVGDIVKFLAPYGRFVLDIADIRPTLFIASGTGLAPIRAQLHAALQAGMNQSITFYYAHYDEDRLFLREEFEQLEQDYTNFRYIPCLTTPSPAWSGKKGLITDIIPADIPNLPDYTAYVCGSPGMVTSTVATLQDHGMPTDQIHFERFT